MRLALGTGHTRLGSVAPVPFSSPVILYYLLFTHAVSRIKAVLRRTKKDTQDPQDVIVLGDIEMNTKKHEVTADGEVVTLTLKEYELLKRLMKNPNI